MKNTIKLVSLVALASGTLNAASLTGTSFDFTGAAPAISGGVLVDNVAATAGMVSANFGYFASGFDVNAAVAAGEFGNLISNFTIISTADVGSTAGVFGADYAGLFDTGAIEFTANAGSPSIGRTIFGMYSLGGALTAGNMSTLGWALVNSGTQIAVDTFPPTSYTVFPATGTLVGGSATTAILPAATFSADAIGAVGVSAPALNIVAIPEPSAALLGALGALGLLRRRRN